MYFYDKNNTYHRYKNRYGKKIFHLYYIYVHRYEKKL